MVRGISPITFCFLAKGSFIPMCRGIMVGSGKKKAHLDAFSVAQPPTAPDPSIQAETTIKNPSKNHI
jgi:hypothetical protein